MKKHFVIIIIISFFLFSCGNNNNNNLEENDIPVNCSKSLISEENVFIYPSEDTLDELVKKPYKEIKGELLLYHLNIEDLSFLKCLEKIETLKIEGCNLKNFQGLNNLIEIENLILINNNNIEDFTGLDALEKISYLEVVKNENLINFKGLDNLKALGGINIKENKNLTSFDGLNKVAEKIDNNPGISSRLNWSIHANSSLKSISSLNKIPNRINFSLNISSCPELEDIGVFKNLKNINSLGISICNKLKTINAFPNIEYIGSIFLYDLNSVEQISFPSLKETSYLKIEDNKNLIGLDFNSLINISGEGSGDYSLEIDGNDKLASLDGFDNLEYSEKNFNINNWYPSYKNPLKNICALRKLILNKMNSGNTVHNIIINTFCPNLSTIPVYNTITEFDNKCNCI
jgi:hypothetical protein